MVVVWFSGTDEYVCVRAIVFVCVSLGDGCHPSSVNPPLGWQQQTEAALPECIAAVGDRMVCACIYMFALVSRRASVWSSELKTLSANPLPTVSFLCFTLPVCTLGKSKLCVWVLETLIEAVCRLQRLPLWVPQGLVFNFTKLSEMQCQRWPTVKFLWVCCWLACLEYCSFKQ